MFDSRAPLARRSAPRSFETYEGQPHLVAPGKPVNMMVSQRVVQSMVFYGPPASGKTALARIIADGIDADFVSVNALTLSSDDIKKIFAAAAVTERQTVLFIDEIHRLNRPKQDAFLEALESGLIILIGATTENPYFALQPALRSRILIFELFALGKDKLKNILHRAIPESR